MKEQSLIYGVITMNLFIEKCSDALERTKKLWTLVEFLLGIWCVKKLYEQFTENEHPVEKIVIAVGGVFALLLAAANILINVIFTAAVWLAVPVFALVHLYKDSSRREELQNLADISADSLGNEQQENLAQKLNAAITDHLANSKPSQDCKDSYNLVSWNDLPGRLEVIKSFAKKADEHNAGRDLGLKLITAFKSSTAYSSGLFNTKKENNTSVEDPIETFDSITASK